MNLDGREDFVRSKNRANDKAPAIRGKATAKSRATAARTIQANAPYARPARKEAPIFTESYKAMSVPVAAIFTAAYIPNYTAPIKLAVINKRVASRARNQPKDHSTTRQETETNRIKMENPSDDRASTGYRAADYYRPSPSGSGGRSRNSNSGRDDSRRGELSQTDRHYIPAVGRPSYKSRHSADDSDNKQGLTTAKDNRMPMNQLRSIKPLAGRPQGASVSSNMDINIAVKTEDVDEIDNVIKSAKALNSSIPDLTIRVEVDPVTIEINNLDPNTSAEDVKVVCSRFGQIKSCICASGFAQVTFARKAAGIAAIENLNGKTADNDKILRVTMRKSPVFHYTPAPVVAHVPSAIAGPMRILTEAVQGTIHNAGTIFSDQLKVAQEMLKAQEERMAQLYAEEQMIKRGKANA